MKSMLQIIADVSIFVADAQDDAKTFDAFNRALDESGVLLVAEGLADPATALTVRFENGSEPDTGAGPFADRDEQLIGFWILETATFDEAMAWAQRAPITSGAIEVRRIAEALD